MTAAGRGTHRRGVWIALAWAATCVVALAVLMVVRDRVSDEPPAASDLPADVRRTLVLPDRAAGFALLDTPESRRLVAAAREGLEARLTDGELAVGLYARGSSQVFYVGLSVADGTTYDQALARSPEEALRDYLRGAGVGSLRAYDPGPLGGALLCGRFTQAARKGSPACGWADDATLATVAVVAGPPLGNGVLGDAAALTVAFREVAEPASVVDERP